jgi:GAF domain-containing protein
MRGKPKTKAQLVKETEALHRINQAISGALDPHETLQWIVNETVDLLAAQSGSVIFVHLAEGEAEVSTSYGHDCALQTLRYPLAGSLVGWVVEHGQPLHVFQLTPDEWPTSWKLGQQLGAAPDDVSVLLVPLWVQNTLVGSLEVVWKPQHRTTEQEVRLLESIAVQVAITITHARLYQEKERALQEVQTSEERFRAAAEGSLDTFFLLESVRNEAGKIEDSRFVEINSRGDQILPLPRDAVLGRCLCALFPIN